MDALALLHERVSVARLGGDMPDQAVLDNLFKAALRAPDHGMLRPWRFLTIGGDARLALGDLFVAAQGDAVLSDLEIARLRSKTLRAPLIVVVVAVLTEHPKIPQLEQLLSAAAAAQNLLLAAHAQGLGAIWRTGDMAYHEVVRAGLGVAAHEQIVWYLYVGQVEGKTHLLPNLSVAAYVTDWPGARPVEGN